MLCSFFMASSIPPEDILRGLDKIEALDEKYIPAKSLSREFIGGSPYDNH